MQIPSVPPPIVTTPLPQDVAAKAIPNVQAVAPLVQRSIDPTPKSEKFNQTRSNKDRGKGGGKPENGSQDSRGGSVNIRV